MRISEATIHVYNEQQNAVNQIAQCKQKGKLLITETQS